MARIKSTRRARIDAQYGDCSVVALRAICRLLGLAANGNKDELVARLSKFNGVATQLTQDQLNALTSCRNVSHLYA